MAYDIGWIIPRLREPGALWWWASSFLTGLVALLVKLMMVLLNEVTVYNGEALRGAVRARPPALPLLTVSNHHSGFDDPGLWSALDVVGAARGSRMRWTLVLHDTCFTRALHAWFFALCKCVPVMRGAGVYQPAMDFCVERLCRGEWVHIFPEGRVNVDKEELRLQWGVGRLVAECARQARVPLILPIWHEGMDDVMPNRKPYRLHVRKRVFISVGEPVHIEHVVDRLRKNNASEEETRRVITEHIGEALVQLRERTHALIARDAPQALQVKSSQHPAPVDALLNGRGHAPHRKDTQL